MIIPESGKAKTHIQSSSTLRIRKLHRDRKADKVFLFVNTGPCIPLGPFSLVLWEEPESIILYGSNAFHISQKDADTRRLQSLQVSTITLSVSISGAIKLVTYAGLREEGRVSS